MNERVQRALKQRDVEIARVTEAAEQAQRRAEYMEDMLDKQNKLLREKKPRWEKFWKFPKIFESKFFLKIFEFFFFENFFQ